MNETATEWRLFFQRALFQRFITNFWRNRNQGGEKKKCIISLLMFVSVLPFKGWTGNRGNPNGAIWRLEFRKTLRWNSMSAPSVIFLLYVEKKKCCIVDMLTQSPQKCPASKRQLTLGGLEPINMLCCSKNREWAGGRSGPQPTEWLSRKNRMVHSKPI